MRWYSGAYTGHFRSGAVWGRVRWPVEVRARLERRPGGEPPTGDDAATCRASGDEPGSHSIAGSRAPGHERPTPVSTQRRGAAGALGCSGLGSRRTDSRGARGASPRPAMMRRPVARAVTSQGATQSHPHVAGDRRGGENTYDIISTFYRICMSSTLVSRARRRSTRRRPSLCRRPMFHGRCSVVQPSACHFFYHAPTQRMY